MKKAILSRTILVATAILFSVVTCYAQNAPSDQVVGNWTKLMNTRTVTFTISPDQKYQVEFAGDEGTDVWGSYTIEGNRITFKDEGGDYSSGETGEYEFKTTDTSLTFKKVNDPVTGRSMLVEGSWTKAGDAGK
jgi:hypothetical protein